MWEMILESGFIASIIGLITSVSGIVITNNFSKKQEKYKIKYELTKDINSKLIEIYNNYTKNNIEDIKEQSPSEIFTNSLAVVYQNSNQKFEELKRSYMSVRYVLKQGDIRNLDGKFKDIENIGKTLFFTSFNDILKTKGDHNDIDINDDVNLIDKELIPEYMRKYIDSVSELESCFLNIIEKVLRKLIN